MTRTKQHLYWYMFSFVVPTVIKFIMDTNVLYMNKGQKLMLFQKYVEPVLFGIKEKQKSLEDLISEMNEGLKKVHADLERIGDQLRQQPEQNNSASKQIQELKSEVSTVKGLLLSRLMMNYCLTRDG